MEAHSILDQDFCREKTLEKDSEIHLLKLGVLQATQCIKYGRYALYAVCLSWLTWSGGMILFGHINVVAGLIIAGVGSIYGGLAWASFRYPKVAFGLAIGIYLSDIVVDIIDRPTYFFQGIVSETIVLFCLTMAFKGSVQMDNIKRRFVELGADEEEVLSKGQNSSTTTRHTSPAASSG